MANSLYGKARRGLSLLLAAFMLFGCLGVTALAEEDPTMEEQTEENGEQPEAPEEEPGEQPEAPEEEPGEQPEAPEEEPGEQPEEPEEEPGEQPEAPEEPLEEVTDEKALINLTSEGYYLVGSMNNWLDGSSDNPEDYRLSVNSGNGAERVISIALAGGTTFKIVHRDAYGNVTWYPNGGDCSVSSNGYYSIYFREDGQGGGDWDRGTVYTSKGSRLSNGYYLIGRNGKWDVNHVLASDKFSDSTDDQGQHTLTTTLTAGQQIKVVKVQDDWIDSWYPNGVDDQYTVDAAHAGNKTIYFKSTYNSDWSAFGGHIWISTAYEDGYYLIKNGWTVDYIDFTNGKFTVNPNDANEYMLSTTLAQGDRIKVVKVESGAIAEGRWYPNGEGTEYTVDASHSGNVTIYFRKDYQDSWASPFGGYFYIVAGGSASIPDGYYMIGSRHNWNVANLTLADKVYNNPDYGNNYPGIDHEWMRLVYLNSGETIKVVHVQNGRITQWYGLDHPINGTYVGNQFLFFMEALDHDRGDNSAIEGDWQWNIGKRFSVQRGYQTSAAQGTASSYTRGDLVKSPNNTAYQEDYPTYGYRLTNGSVTVNTGTAYDANDYQYGNGVPSPNDVYNLYLGQQISMVVTPDEGYEVQGPVVVRKSDGTTFNANYDASTNKITFTMVASDLTVIINLVPKVYNVTVVQPNPVWGKNGANKSTAAKDETVTVTAVPYGGCELLGLPIVTRDDTGAAVEVRVENGAYVFTMPAADVTVSALYEWVFRSCNLELSGEIGVNMYVYLRDVNNTDNFGIPAANRTPEKLYVTFDIHLKDGTTVTKTVKYDPDFRSSGTTLLYGFTCYENVLQLASSFTATLHYIGKDNAEHAVVRNYSAPKYLDTINSMSASDAKDLVKAIADYGYYAQQYMFEIHSGYSAKFDQMPVHYTNSYSYDDVKAAVEPKRMRAYYSTDYASVSFQIVLESATAIKVFITPQNGAVLSTFTIDGEDYTPSVDGSGRYVVTISGIGAGMLGHLYDIRAKATKTDAGTGEETTSDVKIYVSGLSYAYKVLAEQAGSETAAAKNAMCAMYQYYVKAKEYAEAHSN